MANASIHTAVIQTGIFRLLVPANSEIHPDEFTINFKNETWALTERYFNPNDTDLPSYVCISYAWANEKVTNEFYKNHKMSSRTKHVVEAAITTKCNNTPSINDSPPEAIFIDAFCIPSDNPARDACLKSLGAIYSKASQVIVVLGKSASIFLEDMIRTENVDTQVLLSLGKEEWITRVWTYQEIVNSKSICFISEGNNKVAVEGARFLDYMGKAINLYQKEQNIDAFQFAGCYSELSAFEDVIADWLIADYSMRSAYQVISVIQGRKAENRNDSVYAMIGAFTTTPPDYENNAETSPWEYFMQVCEAKGDFSFIFCIGARSNDVGKRWRPIDVPLRTVLQWSSSGESQPGSVYPTHLQVNDMRLLGLGSNSLDAKEFFVDFLKDVTLNGAIILVILERLRNAGFSGCGEYLELLDGYFFSQDPLPSIHGHSVMVSTSIKWVFGAPALLVRKVDTDKYHFCGVGVFIGHVPRVGDSYNLD